MASPVSTFHVLVVDDNPGDLGLLQEAVASIRAPIVLTTCTDGRDALRLLAERQDFDLILSDLNMPSMSGVDLFQRLQQSHRLQHIPMVMMSSSDRSKLPKRLDGAIAVPYFTKAATWEDFIRLAREILAAVSLKAPISSASGKQLAERMTPVQGFAKFKDDGPLSPPRVHSE
jgi:CheY-like chemotaxis protein